MLKNISLLVFCCFVLSALGQTKEYAIEAKISPIDLKEDFKILITSLRENHPGLYDFTTKTQFDSLAIEITTSLTDSLTEAEFHVVVRKFIQVIGCGHTSARPSIDWYQTVSAKESLVPIHVFVEDNELYIRDVFKEDNAGAMIGSRIISINGTSATKILNEMKSILSRDGVGETMVRRNVERLFQTLFAFLYGTSSTYIIEVELLDGEFVKSNIKGAKARKYATQKSMELVGVLEIPEAKFGMLEKSTKIAVLDLNSFPSKGYKKFYRKVFDRLSDMDSVTLIIDLRGNGGGYFPNANQLLRYLLNDNFTMNFDKPQKHTKNSKHLKLGFSSQMTRFILSTIPDRNKEDPDRNYEIRFKSRKRNHFDNAVFVISDGLTFSAGSTVASRLKNSRGAIVVGEETGGGEVGFNAVLSWKLTLPNSKIIVSLPMYHVDEQPKMINVGRGVIPDEPIHYDLKQKIDEIDLELARILQLLELN